MTGCTATLGAAIRVLAGAPQLRDLVFSANVASQARAYLYMCVGRAPFNVRANRLQPQRICSLISFAQAQAGGAVYVQPGSATGPVLIDSCSFVGNHATHLGGGLSIQEVRLL